MGGEVIGALESRVRRLERMNRGLLVAVIAGLTVPLLATAQRSEAPRILRAQKFVVLDEQGRERVRLGASGNAAGLDILDDAGKLRAKLAVAEPGPALLMLDDSGRIRLGMVVRPEGTAIDFFDSLGKNRVALGLINDWPKLRFADSRGETVHEVPTEEP